MTHIRVDDAGGSTIVIGPPAGAPNILWNETVRRADQLKLNPLKLNETVSHADLMKVPSLKLSETVSRVDAYRTPTVTLTPPETLQRGETADFTFTLTALAPSGTPDTDEWGDAWTDNTVGQTGTNHGTTTPLNLSAGLAGVGTKVGWVEANLTRFTGLGATGSSHVVTAYFTNGSAVSAATITLKGGPSAIGGGASRPFTESTITQSNQPAAPSSFTLTANLPAGATNQALTFTLGNADLNAIIGKWATLQFTTSSTVTATPDTMVSREGAAGNRVTFSMKLRR